MHDPVEMRRRIERLVTRVDRRDDYGRLLARGDVVRRIEDIEAWRAEIKRQARADKIKVRTGANDTITWAILSRAEPPGWQADRQRHFNMLARVVPLAGEHRHEPSIAVRDGDELICACDRCPALGYGHVAEHISGGALFEDDCPHEEPGKLTELATMFAPPSGIAEQATCGAERGRPLADIPAAGEVGGLAGRDRRRYALTGSAAAP